MANLDRLLVLAHKADKEGQHLFTHWRDTNNWVANREWQVEATPEAFIALFEQLESQRVALERQLEKRRLEWSRAEGLQAQVSQLAAEISRLKGDQA